MSYYYGMASKRQASRNRSENHKEHAMAVTLDELSRFEEFKENILPAIRQDLATGMSAKDIRAKYAAIVQAGVVTTALIDSNPAARLTAAKDILDRDEGKAKETKDIRHRFNELPDEQLDAILISELQDSEIVSSDDEESGND